MSDYLASLRRYLDLPRLTALMPGHGPVVATPRERIEQYLDHRAERESQILAAVAEGVDRPAAIVSQVYAGVEPALHQLAELTVVAHLEKLVNERQIVHRDGTYKLAAIY